MVDPARADEPGSAPSIDAPEECLHCTTGFGCEQTYAVMFTDPAVGLVGFLHGTICADAWYGQHMLDADAWRLVEVV